MYEQGPAMSTQQPHHLLLGSWLLLHRLQPLRLPAR